MKTTKTPRVGTSDTRYPSRPFVAISYRTAGNMPDLLRFGKRGLNDAASVEIVEFRRTPPLTHGGVADTYSYGLLRLPCGEICMVCTTFNGKGCLLLEVSIGCSYTAGEVAAMAQSVAEAHRRISSSQATARRN